MTSRRKKRGQVKGFGSATWNPFLPLHLTVLTACILLLQVVAWSDFKGLSMIYVFTSIPFLLLAWLWPSSGPIIDSHLGEEVGWKWYWPEAAGVRAHNGVTGEQQAKHVGRGPLNSQRHLELVVNSLGRDQGRGINSSIKLSAQCSISSNGQNTAFNLDIEDYLSTHNEIPEISCT